MACLVLFQRKNQEKTMIKAQELNPQAIQLDDEALTQFCASEATMGGSGKYKEAGVGRFL